ncbi:MAG: hypothetical protein WC899_10720 [bacterium]|jgi:hypothetical protein
MAHTFGTKLRFTGSSAPLTGNYTCGAGSTVLVLSLVVAGTTPRSGGAPTFNGVALTQAGTTRGHGAGYETGTELWYLLDPPAGSAYQISIPNGGTARTIYAIASTYTSATGISALDVANGNAATSGANPSVSVTTTVNGAAIVASMGNGLSSAPTGRTGTSLYETDDGSYSDSGQYLLQASAGAQAMGWTIASDDWCICVAAFKEVPNNRNGTASITGGGTITGAIRKTAVIVAAIGILGHALATGIKEYPVNLHGGGTVSVSSKKDTSCSAMILGGGASAGTGSKGAFQQEFFTYAIDDFSSLPEGSLLSDDPDWSVVEGTPRIGRGGVYVDPYGSAKAYYVGGSVPPSNHLVRMKITEYDFNGNAGLIIRGHYTVWFRVSFGDVVFWRDSTYLGQFPAAINVGDVCEIRAIGDTLTAYANDIPLHSIIDATYPTGSGGILLSSLLGNTTIGDFLIGYSRGVSISGGGNIYVWSEDHSGDLAIGGNGTVAVAGAKGAIGTGISPGIRADFTSGMDDGWSSDVTGSGSVTVSDGNAVVVTTVAVDEAIVRYNSALNESKIWDFKSRFRVISGIGVNATRGFCIYQNPVIPPASIDIGAYRIEVSQNAMSGLISVRYRNTSDQNIFWDYPSQTWKTTGFVHTPATLANWHTVNFISDEDGWRIEVRDQGGTLIVNTSQVAWSATKETADPYWFFVGECAFNTYSTSNFDYLDLGGGGTGPLTISGGGMVSATSSMQGQGSASIPGGGTITATIRMHALGIALVNGGGAIYASAREEAYRVVSIPGGGGIVLASHKGARSGVPIPGGGTVSVQTRKDALVVVRVSGNGVNTGEAVVNARGLVWALFRGGGDIAVTFLAEHPGSVAVTGGGSIVVKWIRSWPYRPVTDIGDPDATALLVEIDLDVCTREFGISPCLGTGAPCYKTWGTCKYISAFAPTKQTYRFCSADYPQIFPDARPYLIAVKWLATEIKQNLTVNARVVLDFIDEPDTDVGFDPYWSQRANHPGTFWKKFFARHINYRGRFVRVYEGHPGAAESTYVLRWTGRLDNVTASGSQFSLESVDILKDISKIEVPPKVSAKLAADIAVGYTVSFSITADADKFPGSGYVRIEDEIIKYESKDDLTKVFSLLSRGQFGTVDSNHPAAEKVQPVRYFTPKSGYDHLLDMLLVDGAIDPVYVDSPAFFFYRDFPQKDIDFTAVVSEPTKLSTLFYEVLDLLDSKAWVSENFKITVRRNVQNQPGRQYYPLDDETSLIDKTVKVDLNEDSRITRVAIFWDLKVVSKSTDQTSYRKIDLAVNPDAETNYDGPIEKKILCRWIDPTIAEEDKVMRYVRNLALRRIVRERDAQTIIHIDVAPKDAGVLTGEFIFMTSNETLAVDGEPLAAIYQVVKRERKKDSYALTLSKVARRKICLIAPSGFPSYASATDAQREYGFVSDIQGKMSDFRYGYFIW